METKFTKENWIFIESNLSIVANGNNIAFTGIPRHVSEIRNIGESWLDMRHRTEPERTFIQQEQKANAKLISASPEMFEALCEFLKVINRTPASLEFYGNAINLAEKAIKKATK